MSSGGDEPDNSRPAPAGLSWRRPAGRSGGMTSWLERSQDLVTVTVGVVLVALAVVLLVAAIADFLGHTVAGTQSVAKAASGLLDSVLLVLILVEIVHTVVLSLREHRLAAQPFIIIGLVAVIRRILLVLTPEETGISVSSIQLALLIGMVAVFIVGLIVVSRYERHEE